jgi:hypothetical protein
MQPSPELRDVILAWFEAVANGDTSWPELHISHDARGIGIVADHPAEWMYGDAFIAMLKQEAANVVPDAKIQVEVREAEAFVEGSVGWGAARTILTLPDGRTVYPRWSATFHLEDNVWRVVQMHASLGARFEDVFGAP